MAAAAAYSAASASASGAAARSFPRPFDSRSDVTFANCPRPDAPGAARFRPKPSISPGHGLSSLIFRFPPNFVRQLSVKKRRNCSNIGVAQIVAASWANPGPSSASAAIEAAEVGGAAAGVAGAAPAPQGDGRILAGSEAHFWNCDGTLAVHGGERLGRGIVTDAITTPVVNTSAYTFKNTAELIEFKEGRHKSFEYGRYGNPTTKTLEEKISALEGAESTLFVASGMTASIMVFLALVPAGGHIVTTTDCYRKTRIFIQTFLPKMGISATIIDPADIDALKAVVEKQKVSLFFTESPTNPYLRCVDIKLVSEICHSKGVLVCVDGTFASPINQKALALGADLVVHSATKYLAGHHDVIGGCISGSLELISVVRGLHHVFGAVLNSNAAYFINRGVKTLHLRIRQQNSTALRMAQLLETHPKIVRVHYPGLPSHPEHYIAKRQMTGFGGVVSFEVDGDLATTAKFIDSLKIPYLAPSFGGCDSIVDQPTIMSYWDLVSEERAKFGIKDNLVRFSFGVEEFEDLKADILQALEKI